MKRGALRAVCAVQACRAGLALAATVGLLHAGPAAAHPTLAALQQQADALVQTGYDRPDEALAGLAALTRQSPPALQRTLTRSRGLVAANAGRADGADGARSAVQALQQTGAPLAAADAQLVLAALATTGHRPANAGKAALAALDGYRQQCPQDPACDWRSSFLALQLLARHADSAGNSGAAREHALAAAQMARNEGDTLREVAALAAAADASEQLDSSFAANRIRMRAQRLARQSGSPRALAQIHIYETGLYQVWGDQAAARQSAEAGLRHARRVPSPRLEADLLAKLSHMDVKAGRPRAALQAVEQALPAVRRHGDRRLEAALLHNAALARIALGQGEAARRTLDELLAAYAANGADGDQAVALREFADAYAAVGQHAEALALDHRERKLAADMAARNRRTALAELQVRFDSEAQSRRLAQMAKDNALVAQQLANRRALHAAWLAGTLVVVLALGLTAVLLRRVQRINRHLAHNHAALREQSQRDPLTGLANRRALQEKAQALGAHQQFRGGLLLVDIDHFKHVNDGHGHASGDVVLQVVAERLTACVRTGDMVVRWGGEEFLVFLPDAGPAQTAALAERLLQAVGGKPVALDSGVALRVTASVGYGSFPLPPSLLPLTLERVVNLADMALYTAKSQGRNRAVGITGTGSADAAALRQVEADFEQASNDGRITLQHTLGPALAAGAAVPPPPAKALALDASTA